MLSFPGLSAARAIHGSRIARSEEATALAGYPPGPSCFIGAVDESCTVHLRKPLSSRVLALDHLRTVLREYAEHTGHTVDLLLIGGLAMLAYGHPSRATIDVGGELPDHVRGPWRNF